MAKQWLFLLTVVVSATAVANSPPAGNAGDTVFATGSYLSSREFWAGICILVFSTIMSIAAFYSIHRNIADTTSIIRITALILIVTTTVFTVLLGYSGEDIAPVLGLLGTIAGYVLGRSDTRDEARGKPGSGGGG